MPRLTRDSAQRTVLTVAAAGLALVLMLMMSACQLGVHQAPTPIVPTPTTSPDATACSQVYGFSGAPAFDLPGFQLPAGTVGVQRARSSPDNRLTVVEYAICVPPGQFGVSGGSLGGIFGGNWQLTPAFPADGRTFTACPLNAPTSPTPPPQPTPLTPNATPSATSQPTVQTVPPACAQLPTMVFALADQGSVQGQGLLVFRLRIASPPHPCGGSFFPTLPGNGYPKDVLPLQGYDETQVPLPPLSLTGQPRVSYQAADGTTSPYAVVPVCTQGTSQSILSDLRRLMPGYGWAPQDTQGTQWVTSMQGGSPLYARFDRLATPQNWTLTMATNLKEVPVFPTPVPTGPDALCSSVPGLEQATPLRLSDPGADFPGDTVAVVARTTRGNLYTITDYFGCAPHFELTSNPANGSGGYPLYAVFDQREWNYANGFPFDSANLQSCDFTPVGNYLTQFCRTNGSVYADIERVAEPGKGLVTFHLLYARKN